ncbi:MAG: sulfatase [Lentisphaerales bacterium]|nr:sulfatase [Lentisphaerales bacterium]
MKIFLIILFILCLNSAAQNKPNIIFIFTDDHAQRAISAYPDSLNKTPNIDRLAQEGMLFQNSFVTNSICGPSRAVILTGKHSHMNGFRKNDDKFDGGQRNFPKLLQAAGYQTAIIGKWHLKSNPQGFNHWDILPGQGHYYNPDFINAQGKYNEKGYVSDVITDKTINWIEANKEKPFMVMMQHKAPHREWMPNLKYLNKYDDVTFPEPTNLFDDYETRGKAARKQDMNIDKTMRLTGDLKVWELDTKKGHLWKYNIGRMSAGEKKIWDAAYSPKNKKFLDAKLTDKELIRWKYQRYIKDYLRCIDSVDESVGRILDYLQESKLADNTIIYYGSDQGFYLGEHGWFDKRFMYEESMRTPLLIKWPGITKPGATCSKLVQNLDYAQTMLEMAGVSAPSDMQGKSLVPLLKEENPAWRESLYYHYYEGEHSWHKVAAHYGIRTERYKLIHFHTHDEWELYDLQNDPNEMSNVYQNPEYKELTENLKKQLKNLQKSYQVKGQ